MGLEDLLKPAKWLDEQVLTQYTKIGKKLNLDQGQKRYGAAVCLDLVFTFTTNGPLKTIFGAQTKGR